MQFIRASEPSGHGINDLTESRCKNVQGCDSKRGNGESRVVSSVTSESNENYVRANGNEKSTFLLRYRSTYVQNDFTDDVNRFRYFTRVIAITSNADKSEHPCLAKGIPFERRRETSVSIVFALGD